MFDRNDYLILKTVRLFSYNLRLETPQKCADAPREVNICFVKAALSMAL